MNVSINKKENSIQIELMRKNKRFSFTITKQGEIIDWYFISLEDSVHFTSVCEETFSNTMLEYLCKFSED